MSGEQQLCAIHQPNFLPRTSTLAKILASSCWVVLDDVQFVRDYQNRARIAPLARAAQQPRPSQWFSLPVHLPRGRASRIQEATVIDPGLQQQRLASTLRQCYRRGADREGLEHVIDRTVGALQRTAGLAEVAEASTLALLELLEWPGTCLRASTQQVRAGRSERLADLSVLTGARTYLCGPGGARYLDEKPFADLGLTVAYAPPGPRPDPLHPDLRLSALHTLMSCGRDQLSALARTHLTPVPPLPMLDMRSLA